MLTPLTAENLGKLDNGTAGAMIDYAIQSAMRDLDDRGEEDGKERQVTIKLLLKKARGQLFTEVKVQTAIPEYRSNLTVGDLRIKDQKPQFIFRDDNAENPEQPTLDDMPRQGE